MQRGALTFADGVGSVRVRQHLKLLIVRHEFMDEFGHALVMYVIIHRAVD